MELNRDSQARKSYGFGRIKCETECSFVIYYIRNIENTVTLNTTATATNTNHNILLTETFYSKTGTPAVVSVPVYTRFIDPESGNE